MNTIELDVVAYKVVPELDESDNLLLRFREDNKDVWGVVVNNWRTPTKHEIVVEVGQRPDNIEWGLLSALSQAREYAPYIPVV